MLVAEKVGVVPTIGLLLASLSVMVIFETATPLAMTGPVPVIVELATEAPAAEKTTVPSAFTTGVAIERVLVSAVKDLSEQVDTPEAFVTEQSPYVLSVPVSVAEKVGVWPATGLLLASRSVMVIVDESIPSAIFGLVPVIVEFAATAAPAMKMTVPPVTVTGERSCRVFVSAIVDLRVQVERPAALVTEQAP